ncbi:hypothetical protein ACFOS0_36040 [Nocardia seriolae]|uniref:hypothetical protein n=1 Tax=Nocardia seriolae TaxID=37332 RepID=UPI001194C75B|nr:hypothetical protein [Nocardia seriolae]GEM22137.1 hypothetical protein NS2_03760 [Nocardia seriolae NBRC 15557]
MGRCACRSANSAASSVPPDPEDLLARASSDRIRTLAAQGGRPPSEVSIVPDTTEVGYEIDGDSAYLAARRVVESALGNGCRKQHHVVAPIVR